MCVLPPRTRAGSERVHGANVSWLAVFFVGLKVKMGAIDSWRWAMKRVHSEGVEGK